MPNPSGVSTRMDRHVVPCKDIEDVLEWMNGNGVPGAKTRLKVLENNMVEIIGSMKWVRGAAGTLIIGILIWVFTDLIPNAIKAAGGG